MAGKSNGVDATEWARAPPKNRPLLERILRAIYDPDDNTFLGRTPKRWGIMIIFYLVFYTVLALLFAACMGGLFMYIDDAKPAFILEQSLIGTNPGVSFRPLPRDDVTIQYSVDNSTSFDGYVDEMNAFIQPYENESWYVSKKVCRAEDNFGYPDAPCFFIKLNKIYGWQPDFFKTDAELPPDMSVDLAEYIMALQDNERNQIWVSCWEEHANTTVIEYPYGRGLPGHFYPYTNQQDYVNPFVAVKFTPPRNTTVIIRCRAWAKNIRYNKSIKEASGYARILLKIDDGVYSNSGTEL